MKFQQYEHLMERAGATGWVYLERVPIETINRDKSHGNQARFGEAIDRDRVLSMGIQLLEGFEFPAVIAWWDGTHWVLCDGNHRVEACIEAGIEFIDLYDINTPDLRARHRITWVANT